MTGTETRLPKWDGRVVNEAGDAVPQFRPPWSRGWFVIRRAAEGVELEARIPGCGSAVTGHADQAAAEAAAHAAWLGYAAHVAAVTGREQERAPWES